MSAHTMTVTFARRGWSPRHSVTCNEPPEALCRASWGCDCEYYAAHGVDERGPWHELANGYMSDEDRQATTPTRHYGRPGGECNYVLWMDSSEYIDELGSGEVTFPVSFTWGDDEYEWEVA
jgi:hypothetical protein